MDDVEMNALCRFCLSREKGLQPIFTTNTTILRKIADVVQLEVTKEDGLPNHICQHCVFQLNSAHRFKQRCTRSVAKLRAFMMRKTDVGLLSPLVPSEESDSDADFDHPLCEVVYTDPLDPLTVAESKHPVPDGRPASPLSGDDRDHLLDPTCAPSPDRSSDVEDGMAGGGASVKEELAGDYSGLDELCVMKHEVEDKADTECNDDGEMCAGLGTGVVENDCISLMIQTPGKLRAAQKKKESKNLPVICEICGKLFKKNHLYYHRKLHTAVRQHECSICHKTFKMVSHLKRHVRLHDGEKSFLCSYCGKSFIDSSNLRNHVRNHKQERNYKCVTCNKCFARAETLTKHLRSHTGEKPYTCEVCARLFPRKDSLIRHMKSHRGERPHKCDSCDRSFTQSYDLKLHRRKHAARQI